MPEKEGVVREERGNVKRGESKGGPRGDKTVWSEQPTLEPKSRGSSTSDVVLLGKNRSIPYQRYRTNIRGREEKIKKSATMKIREANLPIYPP